MGQFIGGLPLINLLGDSDGLGVTVFSNNADVLTPVTPLGPKRQDVLNLINQISASGNTLLFDTIAAQFDALNKLPSKHIKAVQPDYACGGERWEQHQGVYHRLW